ncbi:hypothetical protein NZ47_09340 [Anaerovibrio lipolyticus]|uniref:Uncharacterized protein n=1 Tax=Anaerovibrio lipolyticus TaxID=82374 RepID=A0A0B2K0B3_9FIRM|nr:hypothetical protein [Anaerovibrio lipolyticus]KHM51647.1 hypothetical protein NZ47_09340 [Anaerovibrio lipolyticus]
MKFPDWSKPKTILQSSMQLGEKSATIEEDGFILASAYGEQSGTFIYLNNFLIADGGDYSSADQADIFLPVRKGDIVKTVAFKEKLNHTSSYIIFLPFK